MPRDPNLQEDSHGHEPHGTDKKAAAFVYISLAALIGWMILFALIFPWPAWS